MNRLSIGTFSRLTGLSIDALRWYDRERLLLPSSTDPETGYRSYDPTQFARARLIRRCRLALMPLPDIRQLLESATADSAREVLERHTKHLHSELQRYAQAVHATEHLFDPEEGTMTVQMRHQPPQPFVAARVTYRPDEPTDMLGVDERLMEELSRLSGVAAAGVQVPTRWWLHFPEEWVGDGVAAIDICLATAAECAGTDVLTGTLPERDEAYAFVDALPSTQDEHPAAQALALWLAEQRRAAAPGFRQVTLDAREGVAEAIVTLLPLS